MERKGIKGYLPSELEELVKSLGFEKYRAAQLWREIYVHRRRHFDDMITLPSELRNKLKEGNRVLTMDVERIKKSIDGSIKFLFGLMDGRKVESVYMPYYDEAGEETERTTLCISTMAGCPVGCAFCATGALGFQRNLNPAEIVDQILKVEMNLNVKVSNVVLMGMGEPLLNYENVLKALKIMTHPDAKLISRKRITLSTSGIAPRIKQLAGESIAVKLALSLHATTDELRKKMMPIANAYPLKKLLESIDYYYQKTKMPITYEYIVFEGLNDTVEDVKRLARIARRVPSKINLIPYNDISFALPQGFSQALK
ncbi:MAG: 23S rRNA (adenine(2503)-C(2))-methyltransferase RlmN, partial [Chloroflexota bacterium]